MTTAYVVRFFEQLPFEPFTMLLANGREHVVLHSEFISVGEHALVVFVVHPTEQVEVIDTSLIVSFRTIYASENPNWR